jgi:hypothetical protein
LSHVLNHGVLPKGYYALAEQSAGGVSPDVITLAKRDAVSEQESGAEGGTTVATRPPTVAVSAALEPAIYAVKANRLVIRHVSEDRVVAIVEVVSEGNKASRREFEAFLDKACGAIQVGIHLLVIDLHRPTKRDPQGIHGAIWEALGDESYVAPPDKPVTLASYVGMPGFRAYVEPVAVGDVMPPMPLFLSSTRYVDVPLEDSYMQAVAEIPDAARAPLER